VKPDQWSAFASAIVITLGTIWYIVLLVRRQVKTVIASWFVSTVAVILSLLTYWTSSKASLMGSFLNLVSVVTILSVLLAACFSIRDDENKFKFPPFQKKCLIASAVIVIIWIVWMIVKWEIKDSGVIPNILIQILFVVSYSMLIKKNWNASVNTESMVLWWSVFMASSIGIYTAYLKSDPLAYAYSIRSTFMCLILLFVLHRITRRRARAMFMYGEIV
jgi:hypothetical protein